MTRDVADMLWPVIWPNWGMGRGNRQAPNWAILAEAEPGAKDKLAVNDQIGAITLLQLLVLIASGTTSQPCFPPESQKG